MSGDPVVDGVVFVLSLAAVLVVCVSFYAGLRVGRDQGVAKGRIAGKREGRVLERARAAGERFGEALEDAEDAEAALEEADFPTRLGGDRA